jgi:hypothetical protein
MILAASPNSRAAWRYGLVGWSTSPEFTHALHLAPNRHDISFHKLTLLFSRFCLEVDRYMLGTKHVHLRNSHDRLHMIAMPEKLETNPHLHGFADFSEAQWGDRLTLLPWEWKLDRIWHRVTEGSGTLRIAPDPDRGAALYATKEAFRSDHQYLLSWDFHRSDKLVKRPSAVCLQRTAAVRKARTH